MPISANGGSHPVWSQDGRELIYQEGDKLIAVPYTANDDIFSPGTPHLRVTKLGTNDEDWDLAPDGRVLVVTPVDSPQQAVAPPTQHTVVLLENFFDEVKRRIK